MQPANLPLGIYRGDSQRLRVKLYGPVDAQGNPVPLDLTDVIPKSEIRNRPAGEIIVAFECTLTLPNMIELFLSAASSHSLPAGGVWDLQLSYPSGEVQTVLGGQVSVTPDVTDSTP